MSKGQSGFSLVEAMVTMVVLAAIGAGIGRVVQQSANTQNAMRAISVLDEATENFRAMVEKPYLFSSTIAANSKLENCVKAGTACNTGLTGITVVAPRNSTLELARPPGDSNVVAYSVQGARCAGTNSSCPKTKFPLEAVASFRGTSAGVTFYFCIRFRRNAAEYVRGVPFATVPPSKNFSDPNQFPSCERQLIMPSAGDYVAQHPVRPTKAQYDPTSSIIRFSSFAPCTGNQMMKGIKPDGSPDCGIVTSAANADTADTAKSADSAKTANTANTANTAYNAYNANTANRANVANSANTANRADVANSANSATYATFLSQLPPGGISCGAGEMMRGIRRDGTPICHSIQVNKNSCEWKSNPGNPVVPQPNNRTGGINATCPNGSLLMGIHCGSDCNDGNSILCCEIN